MTDHFNVSPYLGQNPKSVSHHLSDLAETFQPLHGVSFDLRGIIQLESGPIPGNNPDKPDKPISEIYGNTFPERVDGIEIGQKANKVHFLTSCVFALAQPGEVVAELLIHYDDGASARIELKHGEHVMDWLHHGDQIDPEKVGWRGRPNRKKHLSEIIWDNPHPEKLISHIDFVSALTASGPFLVAITLAD